MRNIHNEKAAIQKQIKEFIQEVISKDPQFQSNSLTVQLPDDGLSPQPVIPIVDGFQCCFCKYKTTNRKLGRVHANKEHSRKRERDEDIFTSVRLQSWYGQKRERYWTVDESREQEQEQEQIQGHSQQVLPLQTVQPPLLDTEDTLEKGFQEWKSKAKERRLTLQQKPTVYELDSWLRFTKWNVILSNSKHDILKTYDFARYPSPEETELHRLLRVWEKVKMRALDTLENTDHKDALKWWVSPKNDVASQHPFELPQSTRTLEKYSRIWEQFLCYVIRTTPPDFRYETETGVVYTREQWHVISSLQEALPGESTEEVLQDLLMELCQLIITQDMSALKLYDSPLMHYLAIQGIDHHAESFKPPWYYTGILAGALWIVRLLALELAIPQKPWPKLKLLGKAEIPSVRDRVMGFRRAHLVEGSFSPASSILTQLAKGQKDNRLHHSPANVHWSEDKQVIYFVGKPVYLWKITLMGQALTLELKSLLRTLAFANPLPIIELDKVVDSVAWSQQFRKSEFNFTQHSENKHLDVGYSFNLKNARAAAGDLKMLQQTPDGDLTWIDSKKHWYLNIERQFLRKLMVAMHITMGQPARSPEIGSIKVVNSLYSARNIIVLNGRLAILTTYDKAKKRRGNTEHILRFLPDEMGQLLAQYIVYIWPFTRVLGELESEYLFTDSRGPWTGDELSRELAKETTKHLGVRLTVQEWRHVAIGIAVEWLTSASKSWEKDEDAEDEDDQFAEGDDEEELGSNLMNHIIVRQASHGQGVAQSHYAVNGAFLHRLGPQLISVFEQASLAWHSLFKWKSEGSQTSYSKVGHKRDASQELGPTTRTKGKTKAEDTLSNYSKRALLGLQRILGPNATPKSEGQAAALELVHNPNRKSNIIVLPTSAGKSVLFFSLAAMSTHKSVIVVVPFTQLIQDLVQRAISHGLSCIEWKDENSNQELVQLVIISADKAISSDFLHYAQGLVQAKALSHLFFDECHVSITDTSYRERLRLLWSLRYLDCPITCLTATLMVQFEGMLKRQLMLPNTQVSRWSTVRPTIYYQVVDSVNLAPWKLGIQHVQRTRLPQGKRGILYVRTYQVGEQLSEELGCPFYGARAYDRSQVLQKWLDGPGGWIVATGALGTGINISGILEVVHIDRPYGLTTFAQQSGRGGRDGEVSNSTIIVRVASGPSARATALQSDYTVEKIDDDAMTDYIQTEGCRRIVLGQYLDGIGESCTESTQEVVLCDYCKRTPLYQDEMLDPKGLGCSQDRSEATGSKVISKALREEVERDEALFTVMRHLLQTCVFCTLTGANKEKPHSFKDCNDAKLQGCGYHLYTRWWSQVDLKGLQHCYKCGLPQTICRFVEDKSLCEFPSIMFYTLFILDHLDYLKGHVHRVGFRGEYKDLWKWMKGKERGLGLQWESNLMRVWREICNDIQVDIA